MPINVLAVSYLILVDAEFHMIMEFFVRGSLKHFLEKHRETSLAEITVSHVEAFTIVLSVTWRIYNCVQLHIIVYSSIFCLHCTSHTALSCHYVEIHYAIKTETSDCCPWSKPRGNLAQRRGVILLYNCNLLIVQTGGILLLYGFCIWQSLFIFIFIHVLLRN